MDRDGVVDAGTVAPDELLVGDARAPFGRRADIPAVVARVDAALAHADVVLVDSGDFDRSAALSTLGAPDWFVAGKRAEALVAVDDLLGRMAADVPGSTLLLVVSVVPPGAEWRLTPVIASGAGVVHGYLQSPSTRRLGLVTLTDVAPTVLSALGAPVPDAMVGAPFRYHPGAPDPSRLARLDRDTAYRERVWLPVAAAFIAFQVLAWVLTALVVVGRLAHLRRTWLRLAALAVAAFAPAAMLFRALPMAPGLGVAGLLLLVAIDAAVVAVAWQARRRPLSPLAWIFGATAALIVGDVATGARLQFGGILGYSPQTASRFSGLGNTGFAVLAAAGLLAAVLHLHHAPRRTEALVAVAAFLALLAFVDGAPTLGDDVGGILTLVPVVALTLLALAGRRVTWRTLAVVAVATVSLIGLATAVELMRPPSSRTHLGRLAAETIHHGRGSLVTTVARKASVNLRILRQSVFTAVVPLLAIGLVVLLLGRGRSRMAALDDPAVLGDLALPGSPLRIGVLGALAAGLVRFEPDLVFDLSDEPVVDARSRMRLAAQALLAGVAYQGADFRLDPPPRPRIATKPTVAVIGTGKRTGKTAVSAQMARVLAADGRPPVIVAMGRGGPPEPELIEPHNFDLSAAGLVALAAAGRHAASDHLEDALMAGVVTIGTRRCGGGMAGAPVDSTFVGGVELANGRPESILVLEGSGSAVPPVHADATVCVVPATADPELIAGYLGAYRLLLADLVVVTMAEAGAGAVEASIRRTAPAVELVRTVLRPFPLEPIAGRSVFYVTTAPASAGPVLAAHLEDRHLAKVVGTSHNLARRPQLADDLDRMDGADILLVELKAAGVDMAARVALERDMDVVFCDNRVVTTGGDGTFEALVLKTATLSHRRFTEASAP